MISFYPGPSQVYAEIPKYVKDAYTEGILGINHRSDAFIEMCSATQKILRQKLHIPADYMIFFTSSATECWEIIAQSLPNLMSYHFYNGAFGERWFQYTKKLKRKTIGYHYRFNQPLDIEGFDVSAEKGIICLTPNETSNGTRISPEKIKGLKAKYPEHLIAADVTSSLGGIELPFADADIWYASVQKCLGLPAGMGILICSPKTMEQVLKEKENGHYNSLFYLREKMKDYQTPYTPNVLGIYLLKRTQEKAKDISKIYKKTLKRADSWYDMMTSYPSAGPLIKDKEIRSETVIACEADPGHVKNIKDEALKEGLLIGNGYGDWKENSFRIANFPALKGKQVKELQKFFKSYNPAS